MDMGFVVICLFARHRRPPIRFLFIGSQLCSALLSGPASRRVLFHPCASLTLHLHRLGRGLAPPSCRTCSAHKKKEEAGPPPVPRTLALELVADWTRNASSRRNAGANSLAHAEGSGTVGLE